MPQYRTTGNVNIVVFPNRNRFSDCFLVRIAGGAYLDGVELPLVIVLENLSSNLLLEAEAWGNMFY